MKSVTSYYSVIEKGLLAAMVAFTTKIVTITLLALLALRKEMKEKKLDIAQNDSIMI